VLRGLAALACAAVLVPASATAAQQYYFVVLPVGAPLVLRARPAGPVVATLGPTTGFGTNQVLAVVAHRGPWFAVSSDALPNGRLGWIDLRRPGVQVGIIHRAIHVSLSRRRLDLLVFGRVVRSFTIAVGAASSPTPLGRYAVEEKLPGPRFGAAYGCCILGLTAHQNHPPAAWAPANYLVAIHGGSGVGTAATAGCLHLPDSALRYLFRRVPLGTPVFISA